MAEVVTAEARTLHDVLEGDHVAASERIADFLDGELHQLQIAAEWIQRHCLDERRRRAAAEDPRR